MAKRKARRTARRAKPVKKAAAARSKGRKATPPKRGSAATRKPAARKTARRKPATRKPAVRTPARKTGRKPVARKAVGRIPAVPKTTSRPPRRPPKEATAARKAPRLDRARRTIEDFVPSPPSSLDMDRHGSAARTGRAELAQRRQEHAGMPASITGGDVDVDVENAYFTGDEAPGGDNPTPDQDVVDDIGKALGVEYQDNEELRAADKVIERDRHRWELDPASSEDYKSRK